MDRIKEPSTWAGIAATLATVAPFVSFNPHLSWAVSGLAGFAGGMAMFLRERPGK